MHRLLKKLRRETTRRLSKSCLKTTVIEYKGLKFRVPLVYGIGAGHHLISNDFMYNSLKTFIKNRKGAVIDVGANIGLYLITLRALDSKREYYGFEPNPMCNFIAIEMIRLNHFESTRIFPFAFSDKKELRTLYASRRGDKMGSLHACYRDNTRPKDYSFDLITFLGDELFELLNIESICAIKIDVEGSEVKVLRGIKQTITKYRPYLYCEIWPLPIFEDPTYSVIYDNRVEFLELLDNLDYRVLVVLPDDSLIEINSAEELTKTQSVDCISVHKLDFEQLKLDFSTGNL